MLFRSVKRARRGHGPTLIECRTFRWKGHVGPECDIKLGYRGQRELDKWVSKCPVRRFERKLIRQGIVKKAQVDRITREIDGEVHDAYLFGKRSPDPGVNELTEDVWNLN